MNWREFSWQVKRKSNQTVSRWKFRIQMWILPCFDLIRLTKKKFVQKQIGKIQKEKKVEN